LNKNNKLLFDTPRIEMIYIVERILRKEGIKKELKMRGGRGILDFILHCCALWG
jgi:hypothetical protein